MELKEMIKIMEHYCNGGDVEFKQKREDDTKWKLACPNWNWDSFNYRIKKPNVTIEKWLCRSEHGEFVIIESTNVDKFKMYEKVKLMGSYEVEF